MKALARFKNEIWYMNLAYVERRVKGNNGIKYPLVRQDMIVRTADAEGMKTKDSKETVRAALTIIRKTSRIKQMGSQRNRICWRVQKIIQS